MASKSIIQSGEAMCFICKKYLNVETKTGIIHHCIHGRGLRKLADSDGLTIWICNRHHAALHDDPNHPYDNELKVIAQEAWIKARMKEGYPSDAAMEMWLARYGRFWYEQTL